MNFIISEPSAELLTMQNDMYQKAAGLFANDLYDALTTSGILDDAGIVCGQSDTPIALTGSARADHSFLLWSLIPFITACSGEHPIDQSILFEEVATVRPDGANNIFHADVIPEGMVLPDGYVYMKNWSGPMWKGNGRHIFWQIDSEWSDRNLCREMQYSDHADRVLSLYEREEDAPLSEGEYAWLSECGYIKAWGDYNGCFKTSWQVVILENQEIKKKLLAIGDEISLKAPYAEAMLRAVPTHLKRIKEYELQFVFQSDGWFLLHCIVTLLKNGKLKLPTKGQRKALTTIILPN